MNIQYVLLIMEPLYIPNIIIFLVLPNINIHLINISLHLKNIIIKYNGRILTFV